MAVVTVLYFAGVRERLGRGEERLDLPSGEVAAVLAALAARHPGAAELFATCRLAVDQAFASGVVELRDGTEVAVIPPVSGG